MLGYDKLKECWWLVPGRPLKSGLRALSSDSEVLEMCFHATNNHRVVHAYLEHGVSENEAEENFTPTTTTVKNFTPILTKKFKSTPKISATKNNTTSIPRRVTRSASRFASKEKKVAGEVVTVTLSNSERNDSYKSVEDELYRLGPEAFENSSDYDSDCEVVTARIRECKNKKGKGKFKLCLEDFCDEDEVIVRNSDEDIDLGYVLGKVNSTNSNEESDIDDDDTFFMFIEGARFGKLKLEVGMKFNTKHDFIEEVREFTIQEGRQIKFKNNESNRVRAMCKYKMESCNWIAYASIDHEEICSQIKTFNNDHIYTRRTN
ncbi:hypothetical protein Ahy_A03g010366 [Arachis hypogaea]|uniref:Uncharacterized protein n=1 Tax=Arachis hypogaea TaxID=3818 RepID=A0A445DM29_ARAHY|nr:hypothetical protein Ahy_A03g010366 [Arachis hypogaea]